MARGTRYHGDMRLPVALLLAAAVVPPAPGWHRVELAAHKLFMKAEASITVERCPVSEVAGDLMTPPLGAGVVPSTGMVDVVRVEARMPFRRSERVTVWLDAATGAVLQNEKQRLGRGRYWKVRRYTDDGYYEWRTEPDEPGDLRLPPPRWSDRWEHRVIFDPAPPEGTVVTDPYAFLAALPVLEALDRPMAVASGGRAVEIRLRRLSRRRVRARGELLWPGGGTRLERVWARARWVEVAPGPGVDAASVETGLFGLRGTLQLLLEPASWTPLEIRGRARSVGRVVIRLQRAELNGPPPGEEP